MSVSRRTVLALLGAALGSACVPAPVAVPTTGSPSTPQPTVAPATPVTPAPSATLRPTVEPLPVTTPTPAVVEAPREVLPGVDVLMREQRQVLAGRKLGLVTNATGRSHDGQSTIDVLHAEPSWRLAALFSPEHGIRGEADAGAAVDSSVDARTGLPIYSLYGQTTRPTAAMLRGIDTLVYDIQDIGCRTYTYIATLLDVMRAGAEHQVPVVVLDRPNPIGGVEVEGNVLDPAFVSFVGPAPLAMRYGMTAGELASWFNGELGVGADLSVVPLRAWTRDKWFDQTRLAWVNPSPNLRSLSAAALYPGTVLVEGSNLSEGRGTDRPFEWLGAPWLEGSAVADRLNAAGLPGARFTAAQKTPDASKFAGQPCDGVAIEITDRAALQPMALGVTVLAAARAVAGTRLQLTASNFDRLAGTDRVRRALEAGTAADEIVAAWQPQLHSFGARRERYLLY